MKKLPQTVPEAITELRTRMGLSRQVFATNHGISTAGLANYEKGREVPLQFLFQMAVTARKAGHDDLGQFFGTHFRDELIELTKTANVSFYSLESPPDKPDDWFGLLVLALRGQEACTRGMRLYHSALKDEEAAENPKRKAS